MRKVIKRYGNTNVLVLNKEDMEVYKLKEGDVVDLTITKIKK